MPDLLLTLGFAAFSSVAITFYFPLAVRAPSVARKLLLWVCLMVFGTLGPVFLLLDLTQNIWLVILWTLCFAPAALIAWAKAFKYEHLHYYTNEETNV
jgi:hypothetical protein